MTSRQATYSPRPSRCLSTRASHLSLPLSSVKRPVFHAKRAKIAKGRQGARAESTLPL